LSLALLVSRATAEEKKPDPKGPPRIVTTVPLAVERGSTTTLTLYGMNLSEATEVRAEADGVSLQLKIKSKGKVELPKDAPAEKLGDTQIAVELKIPADARAADVKVTVVSSNGSSDPHALRLYDARTLTPEKEPNGGFHDPQPIRLPNTITGVIAQENDVDVFPLSAKAGETLSAEVFAARLGSPLDSLLTLYDEHGQVLATNDDADTADSFLKFTFSHDGVFFLSLTDAYGKGAAMYAYLLHVEVSKSSHEGAK